MSTWRCGWICPRSYLFAAVFLAGALFRGLLGGRLSVGVVAAGAQQARAQIAARYLGEERGKRFAAGRASPGVVLRLPWEGAKTWDLTPILPS